MLRVLLHYFTVQTKAAQFTQVITFSKLLPLWQPSLAIGISDLNQKLIIFISLDNCPVDTVVKLIHSLQQKPGVDSFNFMVP